jgi:adenylate kinase family enzyme
VRGTESLLVTKQDIKSHTMILKELFRTVHNDHLGSDNDQIDANHLDDVSIYLKDHIDLVNSDLVIADVTNPSLGVGKMICEGLYLNKPVLCLCREGAKISAMINGDKRITVRFYKDLESYRECIVRFLNPLKMIITGLPGSGKGTVAQKLANLFGLVHISTGDLCRNIALDPTHHLYKQIKECTSTGQLVSADLMYNIVLDRLNRPDCLTKGYVLDGYPPSEADRENLINSNIKFDYLFYLDCSDETAIGRQIGRGKEAGPMARATDLDMEKIKKRIDVFHQNIKLDLVMNNWFPNVPKMIVQAEQDPDSVFDLISKVINLNYQVPTKSTFYLEPLREEDVNSTKFHFHIDAPNYWKLLKIVKQVHEQYPLARNQIKIYPIEDLHLCSQTKELGVYKQMQNFHEITESSDEAFVTGKIGDVFNAEFMNVVLDVCSQHNCMTELEEYVYEGELKDGQILETFFEPENISEWIPKIQSLNNPRLELHHAFNINKSLYPKMDLTNLANVLDARGFNIGGLFIFKNENHWAYRTNEFNYDLSINKAIVLLKNQATLLNEILQECGYSNVNVSFSLEIVHGIWAINQ